jgi:hypothetical protein
MFQNIPKVRLFIYLMLMGLLPFVFVSLNFISKRTRLNELQTTLQEMEHKALLQEKKQAVNMAVHNYYRDVDHFYIDKNLETLKFLEPEVESLQKIVASKSFAGDDNVKKRLELLTGPGNRLSFSEGVVQSTPLFQETTETLVHPVEVNVEDLRKILANVEGVEIDDYSPGPNRPQLIVLDFKFDKKNINDKNDVFLLNMKLLKREFQ